MNSAIHSLTPTMINLLKYRCINLLNKLQGDFNEEEY